VPTMQRVTLLLPQGNGRSNAELVARILERLRTHPATRAALEHSAALPKGYVTLDDVGDGPPPSNVPFYNAAIAALTVPAPPGDAVSAIRDALEDLAHGLEIEPETEIHTQ
jgi:hypothetical protein